MIAFSNARPRNNYLSLELSERWFYFCSRAQKSSCTSRVRHCLRSWKPTTTNFLPFCREKGGKELRPLLKQPEWQTKNNNNDVDDNCCCCICNNNSITANNNNSSTLKLVTPSATTWYKTNISFEGSDKTPRTLRYIFCSRSWRRRRRWFREETKQNLRKQKIVKNCRIESEKPAATTTATASSCQIWRCSEGISRWEIKLLFSSLQKIGLSGSGEVSARTMIPVKFASFLHTSAHPFMQQLPIAN